MKLFQDMFSINNKGHTMTDLDKFLNMISNQHPDYLYNSYPTCSYTFTVDALGHYITLDDVKITFAFSHEGRFVGIIKNES